MKISDLIAQVRASIATKLTERATHRKVIDDIRTARAAAENRDLSEDEATSVRSAQEAIEAIDAEIRLMQEQITAYEAEQARDDAADRLSREVHPGAERVGYENQTRVTSEARQYAAETDARGASFERDVSSAFLGDYEAQSRLARHMAEERVERGDQLSRAAGTGAFAGLTVPQYLVDMYAPAAAARRPFADAIRKHELPAQGMVVNLSRITTSTSAALQATENSAVSETNIDDTLLSIAVQTAAGQQTLSRQAIERSSGVEAIVLDDLFRRYATVLDSTLINQATTGLTNVATSVAYTDASPTAAELYPKVLQGLSGVEAALLDNSSGESLAVMHSRRWYWMQSQVGSSWPFIGQPGLTNYQGGVNNATKYGSGVRGTLPNSTPVIVDNNIATNLGAGTNEDEVYIVDPNECHLWEDSSAPLFIRAEQPAAASLGVLLVVYGYFAYTFTRQPHAQKIAGTGLLTPTF